ncbi:plastid ribosomal protein s21 [Trifolium pratense]|uniref:Plastid ribosomal protein s21 n=1 Tax=Trifolium pratense TaxID=57577 RepID=A0A2K3L3I3_TRIPR|nr:plastid ribosomal protein s21 [Trifolium pratense]
MMALSTSFSNLFPFLSPPSKSPQPPQLPLLHHHNNHRNKFIPLVLSRSETSSSVTSSSSQQREQDNLDLSFDSLSGTDSMFYASPYNVQVVIEDDEVEERVVGRFRRDVLRAGVIQEFKRRRYFEDKQEEKKRRIQDAAKRNRRARFPRRPMDGNSQRGPFNNNYWQDDPKPEKEEEDDDDTWDLPEEDVQQF